MSLMPVQFQGIIYAKGPADRVHDFLNRKVNDIPWYEPYCVIQRPNLTAHEGAVISGFSSLRQFPALQTVASANWETMDEYVQTVGIDKMMQAASNKTKLEPTDAMIEKAPEKLQVLLNALSEIFGKIKQLKKQNPQLVKEKEYSSNLLDSVNNYLKLDLEKHLRLEMSFGASLYLGWERFVQFCKSTLHQFTQKILPNTVR